MGGDSSGPPKSTLPFFHRSRIKASHVRSNHTTFAVRSVVIYWFQQIIAVVLGVIWGLLPLLGFLGIAGFFLINADVLYLYFSDYLQIDEEEYGGMWELTKEGFMTSFALFMVLWIISYSAIHYD
uniref:Respirasome Complex Assembly Factor 1 n=1 Tax=Balaenoptera musculus TaxID=9771 RepID=A0A8C0CL42_BALMU